MSRTPLVLMWLKQDNKTNHKTATKAGPEGRPRKAGKVSDRHGRMEFMADLYIKQCVLYVMWMPTHWHLGAEQVKRGEGPQYNRCLSPCIVTFYWRPGNRLGNPGTAAAAAAALMLINGPMAGQAAADAELMAQIGGNYGVQWIWWIWKWK